MRAELRADEVGGLLYLMGPSGAGKDSLIEYARAVVGADAGVVFAHRYITRPAGAGGENHVALGEQEFELRLQRGLFLFHWRSHGLRYGIGVEVRDWLRSGLNVVINGSRAYLPDARRRVPRLLPVMIRVQPAHLRERLLGRGREMDADLQERLARGAQFADLDAPDFAFIDNDGTLEEAGERFVAVVRGLGAPALPARSSQR